jgi:RNA polymerase sigma factor (sigma-70 family)
MRAHGVSTSKPRPRVRRLAFRGDDVLCGMAARGDAEAFGTIYERHHQPLYRYCRSILGNDDDALDALQNTMARAWEALRRDEPDVPLRAWLFRIAHNEALSLLRRRRTHGDFDETHAMSAGTLEETFALRQRLAELAADLAALPERQRSALVLRELCGLGHDEIAAVLAISSATARQAIYEARLGLHEAALGREMTCAAVQQALSEGDGRTRRRRRIRGHLRSCDACSSFAGLLRQRPGQLAALVPPLPTATSAGVLARLLSQASAGAGSSTAAGTTGALGALANLTSGVATQLAVASVVVIVGGARELGRVVDPAAPAATPAIVPSAGEPPVGGDPWPHPTSGRAMDADRASTDSAALGGRAHAPVPAHAIGRAPNEPPPIAAGRDDPAGVPATDVSLDHGPDQGPQTATPVGDPIQSASAARRPSGPSFTQPGVSEEVQAASRPPSPAASPPGGPDRVSPALPAPSPAVNPAGGGSGGAVVEPQRQGAAAETAGRASDEGRPSRPAIDPPASMPNVPAGTQRPASAVVADPSSRRPEGPTGQQRPPAEPPASPAVADSPRRPPEGPPDQQRAAADPPRDPSKRPAADTQRPASAVVADPPDRRPEANPGQQRPPGEPPASPAVADSPRRPPEGPPDQQRPPADPPASPAVADSPRRPPEGPPDQQRPAAEPPRDASTRPSPTTGSSRPTVDSPGPAGNGGSREQPPMY